MECYPPNVEGIRSSLSFAPLIEAWKKTATEGRKGTRILYQTLLDRIKRHPELLGPIDDLTLLEKHEDWVDMLMATLFPVSVSDQEDLYAVGIPFSQTIIYSSSKFRNDFLGHDGQLAHVPDGLKEQELIDEKCATAYKLILSRLYGVQVDGSMATILRYPDPATGLLNFYELDIDPTFINVYANGPLPDISSHIHSCNMADIPHNEVLQVMLPLDQFHFEGITIVRIKNVTHREAINAIKNMLLEQHDFGGKELFFQLEQQMQTLVGIHDLRISITPFLTINNHTVFADQVTDYGVLLNEDHLQQSKAGLYKELQELFTNNDQPVLAETITADWILKYPAMGNLLEQGYHSAIFFPLKSNGKLIGVLSAFHAIAGRLRPAHIGAAIDAIPLFVLAIEKGTETLYAEVDRVIKQHFTAVQTSVEWKFTDAALDYIASQNAGKKAKIAPIVFDHVFPLYGAIDVRNSSIERNNAIQLDLLEQLHHAADIVKHAMEQTHMPLLEEVAYRIQKYSYNVSNILFSGDEVLIDNFLRTEVVELFEHLRILIPDISQEVDDYFAHLDPAAKLRVNHRHDFEESITLINQELARFIDLEQKTAQKIYPHYFERFVTDGVDFNMYIGQSISPLQPFDTFYLKNLKMWQLTTLAKAAQLAHQLQNKLKNPLQTTQLVLAHSLPISISFRTAERKFDVDGAYNIRYEIIKKRIDKVHVKDSNERLTQPGKLAIVFSQSKESAEYLDYIEFLQNQGLLLHDLEQLDLEELQGVVGLKALRVGINLQPKETPRDRPQIIELNQN